MSLSVPVWLQNGTYSARLDRILADIVYTEGVVNKGSGSLLVSERAVGTNNSTDIAAGAAIIEGDDESNQGKYVVRNEAIVNLSFSPAPTLNSRIDLVILEVNDSVAGNNRTPADVANFRILEGTAASSPVVPSVPDTAIPLAEVLRTAGDSFIDNSMITDRRVTFDLSGEPVGTASLQNDSVTDAKIDSVDASKMTTGTLNVARIPNLDVAKITSGTFVDARIPNLAAAKITSGTFVDARIPNLDAAKINSGRFITARLPTSATANRFLKVSSANTDPVYSAIAATDVPSLATSKINSGRFITARLPTSTTANRFLKVSSANTDPVYSAIAATDVPGLDAAKITGGTLPIARGGTGGGTTSAALGQLGAYGKGTAAPAGNRITISGSAPNNPGNGDIWIQP
jgi:hypothetical protein